MQQPGAMHELRDASSLRADFLGGVLIELQGWQEGGGPAPERVGRMLHRWIGTGGTIGLDGFVHEARALRAATEGGEPWDRLRPRCEQLLGTARALFAELGRPSETHPRPPRPAVQLRLADHELRALVTRELETLRPVPLIGCSATALDALVVCDGAGSPALASFLQEHAALPSGRRPRVLVLCSPGVAPGWIAQRAERDVQFLVAPFERAHLHETLVGLLQGICSP